MMDNQLPWMCISVLQNSYHWLCDVGRILTLVVETGDYLMVFISSQAAILNLGLCLCATYYAKPKDKTAWFQTHAVYIIPDVPVL